MTAAIAPLLLIVVLAWPMLFTDSGIGGDWEHHLWYVWQQSLALRRDHAPSPFLSTAYSVFSPQYLFYGGTINVVTALLSLIPGSTPTTAYVFTFLAAYAAAYGGWYWAARMAGLSRLWAHAPALLYITSACYLMLIYGEGAWTAFLASSMMPMIVAAGLSVLRAERTRLLPACALAGSTIVFFGSHNITMVWGSTTIACAGLLVLALVPEVRRRFALRSWLRVAAILVPAILVNAWSLLPALAYSSHTKIATEIDYLNRHYGLGGVPLGRVLTLSRAPVLYDSPGYALELPTLAMAWAAVGLAIVLWRARQGSWARVAAIFCAITAALVVTMSSRTILSALPAPYDVLQFAYRLDAYILMGATASVLAVLVCLTRGGSRGLWRWFRWALAPVVLVSIVGAVQQVDAYQRTSLPRSVTFTPGAEVFAKTFDDYAYAPLPVVYREALPGLEISPAAIHDSSFSATVRERPGQLVYTNIGGGPDLLHIAGARVVGRDAGYHLVLAMGSRGTPSAHPRAPVTTQRLSIGPSHTAPIVIGRLLSYGALVFLVGELLWAPARRSARRRHMKLR